MVRKAGEKMVVGVEGALREDTTDGSRAGNAEEYQRATMVEKGERCVDQIMRK